jgi:hypothetical protein
LLGSDSQRPQTQIPYSRLIRTLTESALPPLILGLLHLILLVTAGQTVVLNVLWVSFTVRSLHSYHRSLAQHFLLDSSTSNHHSSGPERESRCRTKTRDVFTNAYLSHSIHQDNRNLPYCHPCRGGDGKVTVTSFDGEECFVCEQIRLPHLNDSDTGLGFVRA